jgi:hypothetical protein
MEFKTFFLAVDSDVWKAGKSRIEMLGREGPQAEKLV